MRRHFITAILYTLVTTVVFGIAYPLLVTGIAQAIFKDKANGQLISSNGNVVGSKLLGQSFSSVSYFHSRPSAAGNGYDAANSGGSNYGPTNQKLVDRVTTDTAAASQDQPGTDVPVDLVTASGSGLDPDITPAAAEYQLKRIAAARHLPETSVQNLIDKHTLKRQFGFLGEPRVNVLELNLELDRVAPYQTHAR